MRIIAVALLGIAAILGGIWIFRAGQKSFGVQAALNDLRSKLQSVSEENEALRAEANYFSKMENLEKEIKKRFNYREKDEKLMIIVP